MADYSFLLTDVFLLNLSKIRYRVLNEFISWITLMQGIDDKVIVEIFLEGGSEFTAIVLDAGSGSDCQPIVLLPTEVHAYWYSMWTNILLYIICFFYQVI